MNCKNINIIEQTGGKNKKRMFTSGIKRILHQAEHLCKNEEPFLYEKNE